MDGEALLDVAEQAAMELASTSWEHPFGPDWDVFKVGGKVFLLTTQVPGRAVVTVKCEPEVAAELIAAHPHISPGYHMDKRHWLSVWAGANVAEDLVRDLVENSYRLVAAALPHARRPVTADVRPRTDVFRLR
ncbi:MmcQ/YjbR family DNA-binding protein [Geodermatophilus sp. SYSU D00079]